MAVYTQINDPSAFFKVQLYIGTGSSHAVTFDDTDTDMQPDLVWVATRNEAEIRPVMNSLSGTGKYLRSNANDTEESAAESIKAFGSDGFTMGTEDRVNQSSNTFVAWCWKGGTTSSISGGSIATTSQTINTTSKFGIYLYDGDGNSGDTLAHGLGTAPDFIITKRVDAVEGWQVFHQYLGNTKYLILDTNAIVPATSSGRWNDTTPSSTLITLGNSGEVNSSGNPQITFAFSNVQGFFKASSYVGNGQSGNGGTFIHLGFRAALIMVKRLAVSTGNWWMWDDKRKGYNFDNDQLYADYATAEGSGGDYVNILSNGFQLLQNDGGVNGDGESYIYAAWAKAPFVNSNGVPCNAR